MSSTSRRQGLSKTQTLFKRLKTLGTVRTRVFALSSILILTTVLGASAFTVSAHANGSPQSGLFATSIFTYISDFFTGSKSTTGDTNGVTPQPQATPPDGEITPSLTLANSGFVPEKYVCWAADELLSKAASKKWWKIANESARRLVIALSREHSEEWQKKRKKQRSRTCARAFVRLYQEDLK